MAKDNKDVHDDQGEAFLREVDEDLRRDQLAQFWKKYGRWLLIGIGAGLVGLAAFLYWREQRAEEVSLESDRLARAIAQLEAGDASKAKSELKALENEGTEGVKALARLAQAAQLVREGDAKAAAAAFEALAKDESLPQPFRDLANFRAIQLQFDAMAPQQAIERLKPMAQDGTPWFGPAGELLAVAYLKTGQTDLARTLFEAISGNEDVAPSLRGRASQMLSMLPEPAAGTSAAPAKEAQPAGANAPAASSAAQEPKK